MRTEKLINNLWCTRDYLRAMKMNELELCKYIWINHHSMILTGGKEISEIIFNDTPVL